MSVFSWLYSKYVLTVNLKKCNRGKAVISFDQGATCFKHLVRDSIDSTISGKKDLVWI